MPRSFATVVDGVRIKVDLCGDREGTGYALAMSWTGIRVVIRSPNLAEIEKGLRNAGVTPPAMFFDMLPDSEAVTRVVEVRRLSRRIGARYALTTCHARDLPTPPIRDEDYAKAVLAD